MVIHQRPEITASADNRPLGDNVLPWMCVPIHKNRIDVICTIVALEGGDVGSEVIRWHN